MVIFQENYWVILWKNESIIDIRSVELDGVKVTLTKRQHEILQMIVKGFDNKQISQALYITKHCEKQYNRNYLKIQSKVQNTACYLCHKEQCGIIIQTTTIRIYIND